MLQLHWIKSSILPNSSIKSSTQNISKWTNHGHIYKNEVSPKCIDCNKLNHDQSSTTSSCNPDQLQHHLAALNPTTSNLVATLPCCLRSSSIISSSQQSQTGSLKRSSSKPITHACPYSTSLCTRGANVEDRFFGPRGVTSLATHAPSTYYSFFG